MKSRKAKKPARSAAKKKSAARGAKQEDVTITVPQSGPPKVDKNEVRLKAGDAVVFDSKWANWRAELELKSGEESPFRYGKKKFKGSGRKGVVKKGVVPYGGQEKRFKYSVSVPGRPVLDPDIVIEPEDNP